MAKAKIDLDKIAKEIEKIKKNFKGSEKNPYRVIIFNQACEWEHRAYPVLSLAMAVCADFWTNKIREILLLIIMPSEIFNCRGI